MSEARLETAVWGAGMGLWELDFRTGSAFDFEVAAGFTARLVVGLESVHEVHSCFAVFHHLKLDLDVMRVYGYGLVVNLQRGNAAEVRSVFV